MGAPGSPKLVPSAHCLAIAQQNQQQSPLLRLPAELRARVYQFTMGTDTDKILHDDHPNWDRLDFSRTSRQIFAETAEKYFKTKVLPLDTENGISFGDHENWQKLIIKLTPLQRSRVKKVVLDWRQLIEMLDADINPVIAVLPHLPVLGIPHQRTFCQSDRHDIVRDILLTKPGLERWYGSSSEWCVEHPGTLELS